MNMKKFLAASSSAAVIATSFIQPAQANHIQFTDLQEGDGYYKEVMALVEDEIINGYEDNTFRPGKPLIREHASFLFVRALKLDVPENAEEMLSKYTDVESDEQVASFVAAMDHEGILSSKDTTFRAKDELTREEMATWLVNAFDLEPIEDVEVTLSDLEEVSHFHRDDVKILFQNGITKGKADGTYSPNEAVNRGQFATFLHRAMQKITSVERPKDILYKIGESELNLPDEVTVSFGNGQTEERNITWNKENLDLQTPGTYTIEGQLSGIDENISQTIIVEEVPLTIENVTGNSLKQIEISLNHSRFDKDVFTNKINYKVLNKSGDQVDISKVSSTDHQLFVTLEEPIANESTATLILTPELFGEEQQVKVQVEDTTKPTVERVDVIGSKKVKVTFSEPINFGDDEYVINRDILSAFEIDDGDYYIRRITPKLGGKTAVVELYSTLDEGEHQLDIKGTLSDFARNEISDQWIPFSVEYEDSRPKVAEVVKALPNQVTLRFDKEIELADKGDIEEYFHHSNDYTSAEKIEVRNNNEVVITFDQKDLLPSETTISIEQGSLVDLWGNTNLFIEQDVTVENDETSPSIDSVTLVEKAETSSPYVQLKVHFSEPLQQSTALDTDHYELSDANNNKVDIQKAEFGEDDNTVYLTIDKRYGKFANNTYFIHANNVADLFGNTGEVSYNFQSGSEEPPKDFKGKVLLNGDDIIVAIDFGTPMATEGSYSITDLSKYELAVNNESALLQNLAKNENFDVDIDTYNNGQKAEITIKQSRDFSWSSLALYSNLKDAILNDEVNDIKLVVGMVADDNGTKTESFYNNIDLNLKSNFGVVSTTATNHDTIEVILEDTIDYFDENDIIVYADENNNGEFDNDEYLPKSIEIVNENGESKLVITLEDELDNNGTFDGEDVYITSNSYVKTTNRFDQQLEIDNEKVTDAIVSSLQTNNGIPEVYVHPATGDSDIAVISLPFDEDIDPETVTRLSFTVGSGDYNIQSVKVEDNTVYLVVDLQGKQIDSLSGEIVEQQTPIADANNNLVKDIKTWIQDVEDPINLSN